MAHVRSPHLRLCVSSILALLWIEAALSYQPNAGRRYYVGGWISSPKDVLMKKLSPLLGDYLTEQIGPLYDPPVSFELVPFDYDDNCEADDLIAAGQLDFAYHSGGGTSCLEAQFGYTEIATEVQLVEGREEPCYGAVIYSLKSNQDIKNISDFSGKRIGVGYPLAPGGFLLGAQYLNDAGSNIYTDFSQVVFYMNDYAGLLNGIIVGDIDVAITQSGWLENNFPDQIPKLLYHNLINSSWHGVPYTLPTTTSLVPNYAVSASPNITLKLQEQVADALGRINASHPAAKAASVSTFVLPASYETTRILLEKLGFLRTDTAGGKVCLKMFTGLDKIITCPAGYALERNAALQKGCKARGIPCPAGVTCFCQPCHPDAYVSIFPWQFVLGLCCTLFAIGLCFSVCWTVLIESGHLLDELLTQPSKFSSDARKWLRENVQDNGLPEKEIA